jgi:hypothetical protein
VTSLIRVATQLGHQHDGVAIVIEILFEIFFELILDALGRGTLRAKTAVARETSGTGEPAIGWRVVSWLIPMGVGSLLGLWRGSRSDGQLTWGWWLAVVIVGGCVIGLVRTEGDRAEPPVGRWRRAVRWWPRRRIAWFLVGNAAFAGAYLLTR